MPCGGPESGRKVRALRLAREATDARNAAVRSAAAPEADARRAHSGLAEPFRGIASGGEIVPGLFALEQTGLSLAPVLEAARPFVAALAPEQRKAACFAIDDEAWRQWSNIHPWLMRHGLRVAGCSSGEEAYSIAILLGE